MFVNEMFAALELIPVERAAKFNVMSGVGQEFLVLDVPIVVIHSLSLRQLLKHTE